MGMIEQTPLFLLDKEKVEEYLEDTLDRDPSDLELESVCKFIREDFYELNKQELNIMIDDMVNSYVEACELE